MAALVGHFRHASIRVHTAWGIHVEMIGFWGYSIVLCRNATGFIMISNAILSVYWICCSRLNCSLYYLYKRQLLSAFLIPLPTSAMGIGITFRFNTSRMPWTVVAPSADYRDKVIPFPKHPIGGKSGTAAILSEAVQLVMPKWTSHASDVRSSRKPHSLELTSLIPSKRSSKCQSGDLAQNSSEFLGPDVMSCDLEFC